MSEIAPSRSPGFHARPDARPRGPRADRMAAPSCSARAPCGPVCAALGRARRDPARRPRHAGLGVRERSSSAPTPSGQPSAQRPLRADGPAATRRWPARPCTSTARVPAARPAAGRRAAALPAGHRPAPGRHPARRAPAHPGQLARATGAYRSGAPRLAGTLWIAGGVVLLAILPPARPHLDVAGSSAGSARLAAGFLRPPWSLAAAPLPGGRPGLLRPVRAGRGRAPAGGQGRRLYRSSPPGPARTREMRPTHRRGGDAATWSPTPRPGRQYQQAFESKSQQLARIPRAGIFQYEDDRAPAPSAPYRAGASRPSRRAGSAATSAPSSATSPSPASGPRPSGRWPPTRSTSGTTATSGR